MPAIPSSGELRFSMINGQFNRSLSAQVSIATAATGGYGAINTASAQRPNGTTPHNLSEWYGYHHAAASYTAVQFSAYSNSSGDYTCSLAENWFNYYRNDSTGVLYTTSGGSTVAPDGYYTAGSGPGKTWYHYLSGLVYNQALCGGGQI